MREPDLARDGKRGLRMVAGDHDHADAGRTAGTDRRRHFGAHRIRQTDESRQRQLRFPLPARCVGGKRAVRKRQHPHAIVCKRRFRGTETLAVPGSQRRDACGRLERRTQRQYRLERSLAIEHASRRRVVQGGEPLAVAVERDLVAARIVELPARQRAHHLQERDFHWIAEQLGVAFNHDRAQCVTVPRDLEEPPACVAWLRCEARRVVIAGAVSEVEPLHVHAVSRQRAGLVGADHGGRAERLDRGQMPDQGVAFCHALRRHRQRQCHRGQQAFGNIGDDDADRENKVGPERQAERVTECEEHGAEQRRERRNQPAQSHDFELQR